MDLRWGQSSIFRPDICFDAFYHADIIKIVIPGPTGANTDHITYRK